MTDRDRLIELNRKAKLYAQEKADERGGLVCIDDEVDHLLANGVIVPPCKVGETVYCIIQGFENPLKATINRITVQISGVVLSCSVLGYFGESYMATDFGKTVFLTKEEAEEKLKELGKNG